MNINRHLIAIFLSCGLVLSLSSCAAKKRVIDDLPRTYLEDANLSHKIERLPFQHSWSRPGTNWSNYHSFYIKPVRSDLLPASEWTKSESVLINSLNAYRHYAREIAQYFHQQLVDDIKKQSGGRIHLVNQPGPGVLTLDIALTELEFSHPVARAGSLAAPIPGTGAAIAAITDPHAAFALRLTDSTNGRLIATAADRKFAPTRIIDLNKLTVGGSVREICSLWSESISQTLTGNSRTQVSEKSWDWKPW